MNKSDMVKLHLNLPSRITTGNGTSQLRWVQVVRSGAWSGTVGSVSEDGTWLFRRQRFGFFTDHLNMIVHMPTRIRNTCHTAHGEIVRPRVAQSQLRPIRKGNVVWCRDKQARN